MEGGAAAATLQVLVQNLINVSKEEISLVRGLEKDAEKLKESLAVIQSYLNDAEKKFITDEAVKTWLKKLETQAFDADNVLDELNYHVLSKKVKKTMKEDKKKAPSCFPSFNHCTQRRQMALAIKQINKNFESIKKDGTELGLERRLENAPAAPDARPESNSFTLDPIFIGRDDDVSGIVGMLTSIPTEQVFSVLPIVGMGGLGKTTLTRNAFNHERIKSHFGERIWVHVPKNFNTVSLLEKIFTTLKSVDKVEAGSSEVILKKLQEALKDKKCLLVLDDMWDGDRLKWESFINSLSGISSMKGNGIIVTTRIREVASIVKTHAINELNGLSEEDCWSIIKRKAFEGGDIPPGFEMIGRNIAKRCQGLPLAANIVGGVLRGKSRDDWLSIQQNWLPNADGNEDNISNILQLSYDNLPCPSLQKCFAYCSVFPKGYEIKRQQLIELWMAEGFLQINDMEDKGNRFFNLLLQNSLLQIASRTNYGDVYLCSMHDLVHDLACTLLNSKVSKDSDGICQVQYIGHEHDGSPIRKEQAKCLRTLFFKGEVSDSMFLDFKCLHVLILMDNNVVELPSSIGKLIHLRNLDIERTRIRCLPDSIGELYHLQTFSAGYSLKKLPSTFKYLISLRHLHIAEFTELPHEVGKLTSLQTLCYFLVGEGKGQQIVELGGLTNLRGKLEIRNLENVHDKEEAKRACLFQKPSIVELVLKWSGDREGETNDENVLEGLQPHPNLKSLHIEGFRGTHFPSWTMKMAVRDEVGSRWIGLDSLVEITLDGCKECEEIPMLGHLPHLRSLILDGLTNVRSIGSSFYGVCKKTVNVFAALESLELRRMSNLKEWVGVEFPSAETQPSDLKVFPCLEYLKIDNCEELMSAPSHFPSLKVLDVNKIKSGLPLVNICGMTLTSLRELEIDALDGLECLPDWLFHNNKNLTELKIMNCPNLRELPDGLQTLNSLEVLVIGCCPNLKSIPCSSGGQSQCLTSLRSLSIRGCEKLINLPGEIMKSSAPSLERLFLQHLVCVTNFGVVIDCLPKMDRLADLSIINVHQFISRTCIEIGNLCSLRNLKIGPFSDTRDCGSFKKSVDGILQLKTQSLNLLTLRGMEEWDSLPDQLQHLTALSFLHLSDFGIETLPEWFDNLSSLSLVKLSQCKKLRSMPSKEAMKRLTKLDCLVIEGCPLLEEKYEIERQNDDSNYEWSKISHIQFVFSGPHHFNYGKPMR